MDSKSFLSVQPLTQSILHETSLFSCGCIFLIISALHTASPWRSDLEIRDVLPLFSTRRHFDEATAWLKQFEPERKRIMHALLSPTLSSRRYYTVDARMEATMSMLHFLHSHLANIDSTRSSLRRYLFYQPSTSHSIVHNLRNRYRFSSYAYLYTRTAAMTSLESHESQDMANAEPYRVPSPTMSTSPASSASPAVPNRVLAPSPTISNLDLDEEGQLSDTNPPEATADFASNPEEAAAEFTSEPHEVPKLFTSEAFGSGDMPTLDTHQSPARSVSTSEPHESPTKSLYEPHNSRAVSASEPHESPEQSASKPLQSPKTSNLESPKSRPKSASEPDSSLGSDESTPKSTSEPDLTPMTSNRESRKSSKFSMPGSYMSSNVDMSEPEESHQSPADSADASEQSPSPAKTPPPPPPKGSYAAVDRDLLYTVR